jgi:hypothetical protein
MTLGTATALLASSTAIVAGAGAKVALHAPGHTPVIGTRWYYTVSVTRAGKPVAATITEQIVDPIGGVHPVAFGTSTKNITNWPIRGTFRDFILWPADSREIPLRFRVTVRIGASRIVDDYPVTPRR